MAINIDKMSKKEYFKDYYQKHKEEIKKQASEWNQNNVKRKRISDLKWYHKNKQIRYEKKRKCIDLYK